MKKCHNCHAELMDEAMFCSECGSKQKAARVCPHCGCEQDEEVVFCTQCGKKIEAEPVPEVPVTVSKPAAAPSEIEVPPVQEEPKVPEKTLEELEAEQKSLVTTLYEQNKLDLAYTEACKLYGEFSSNENFLLKEEISDKYVEELIAKYDELLRTEQNSLAMVCVKKALSVKPNDLGLLSRKATVESIGTAKTKKTIRRFLVPLVIIAVIGAIGWFVYSIIINKPKEEVAESVVEKKEIAQDTPERHVNLISGHEYVDLGLTVKWATCNVGANKPEDYGGYYAWGETSTKSSYTWGNCFDCLNDIGTGWSVYRIGVKSMIEPYSGHDTARQNWGGTWRMPTQAEFEELCGCRCTWMWTSKGGHNGYEVTGPNGNSIFLPAAGFCDDTNYIHVGDIGCYWASTLGYTGSGYARAHYSRGEHHFVGDRDRCLGYSVRPVTD